MLRTDSYAIYPETDRFHRIRRIARQPFVACMARPLSLRLSVPPMTRSARGKNSRRRSLRWRGRHNCGCGRAHMRQICKDVHLLARMQSQGARRYRRRLGTRRPGCDAQKKGIGVLLRATATTSCDPARLEGSGWLQPCRSARPDGCARCPPRAAPALRPLWTGAHPKSRSAAA
jgi:hypothetical protein